MAAITKNTKEVSHMNLDVIIQKINVLKEISTHMENSLYGMFGSVAISLTLFAHNLAFYGILSTFACYSIVILKKLKDNFMESNRRFSLSSRSGDEVTLAG